MKQRRSIVTFVAAALSVTGPMAQAGDYLHPSPAAGWSQRVQIIYDAASKSVARKLVKVWNPSPEKDLDFVWEPAGDQVNGGLSADGNVEGRGRLVWRVKGSASYDPKSIFSTYSGSFAKGRPDGRGRFELRTGETIEGEWRDGHPNGQGVLVDADGNRYEGALADGAPEGEGTFRAVTGEIYTGPFHHGLKEGVGQTRMAGGTVYTSKWRAGSEIGGVRPDVLADAQVGGLIKAQAGGGDAGKFDISVAVDERMNQRSEMRYQQFVDEKVISIYMQSNDLNGYWNGTGEIPSSSFVYDAVDWESAPAFVEVTLGSGDGSRAMMQKLQLDVAKSAAYRKPMLQTNWHLGCVGFRPTFTFVNHGWGEVKNAKLTLKFTTNADGASMSRPFVLPIADFDQGADVDVTSVLKEAGVNTDKLVKDRFPCRSKNALNVCRSKLFNDVGFGEVADFIEGENKLSTTLAGTIDYDWSDDDGAVHQQSEAFKVDISLAVIEVPEELAECGAGFGGAPEALRYQDVHLPLKGRDYTIDMPLRGNRSIATYKARLKMYADQSSFHEFRVHAAFSDGSTRDSKPISLFFFKPRPITFESQEKLPICYLTEDLRGCG